tara:strand:+ start:431 stop:1297 length:867 start_codon:yes stop_codon:yes gene_type:complete
MKRKSLQEENMNEAIEITYTKEQYQRAVERAKQHPDRSRDPSSITRGYGLITGCLGEIIIEDYLLEIAEADNDEKKDIKSKLQFDIRLNNGTKLEVKSKGQSVNSCPNFYDCSVSAFNSKQQTDHYVFVRIQGRKLRKSYGFDHSQSSKAWICGLIEKEEMINPKRLLKRGTIIENSSYFKYKAKSNCYQIKISELKPLQKDFGKKVDLIAEGQLTFKNSSFQQFAEQEEEDEYFFVRHDPHPAITGYYQGLNELTTEDRKHFEENVDRYIQKLIPDGKYEVQRFKRV